MFVIILSTQNTWIFWKT